MRGQPVLAIANRAEIAIRIARTARARGWHPVALLGDPDLESFAAREIGDVERVGPAGSELDPAQVVAAARRAGATALHPGYGFLSERAELSRACEEAGIVFVGPTPETLATCGDKIATRAAAERAGVPVLPASRPLTLEDEDRWRVEAQRVGFPLIAKVAGGGGGRGLRVARDVAEIDAAVLSALREAGASGAGTRLYLERFLEGARHVEVQVAGDGADAVALGDRDCSVQRRHQKVIEEAPAFGLGDELRAALHAHAVAMAREVRLRGVGTVEFLLSAAGELFFIEVNPRLQVEHTVTEEVTGLDLVAVQLAITTGGALPEPVAPRGHAIQARLYAEDPSNGFAPSPGLISVLTVPRPRGLRVDLGYESGDTVPSTYDALIGKWIARGESRDDAIAALERALQELRIAGIASNRPWLLALLRDARFRAATHTLELAAAVELTSASPRGEDLLALGVAIWHERTSRGGTGSAWSAGPFRLVSPATEVVHGVEAGGWEQQITWRRQGDRWRVAVDDAAADVSADVEPSGCTVVATAAGWELATPDGRWLVQPGPTPREAAGAHEGDGALRAPMPGSVVAVNVAPGQRVAKGDVLVVMTAMKMEMGLSAPFDGVVVSVGCAPGELVGTQQPLVRVERPVEGG